MNQPQQQKSLWQLPPGLKLEVSSRGDDELADWLKEVTSGFASIPPSGQKDVILATRLLGQGEGDPEAVSQLYERYDYKVPTPELVQGIRSQLMQGYQNAIPGLQGVAPSVGVVLETRDGGLKFRRFSLLPGLIDGHAGISTQLMVNACATAGTALVASGCCGEGFPVAGFFVTDTYAIDPDSDVSPDLLRKALQQQEDTGLKRVIVIQVSTLNNISASGVIPVELTPDGFVLTEAPELAGVQPVNMINAVLSHQMGADSPRMVLEQTVIVHYLKSLTAVSVDWHLDIFR